MEICTKKLMESGINDSDREYIGSPHADLTYDQKYDLRTLISTWSLRGLKEMIFITIIKYYRFSYIR